MLSETPGGGARRRLCTGIAAALLAGLLPRTPAVARGLRTGVPAPAARLGTLDGQDISTAELLGQVVILTFWATWCVPCREELPLLSRYAEQHAVDGLKVLGFGLDTPDQLAEVHVVAQALSFPVGLMSRSKAPGY